MATYKNIRINKRGGGTRIQRVQVLASGKYKFVKNKTGTSKTKTSTSKKTTKRRSQSSTRSNKTMGKRNIRIPMAVVAGFATPFVTPAPSGQSVAGNLLAGDFITAADDMRSMFTGFDSQGQFHPEYLKQSYLPMVIGVVVHKTIGKWVNRQLGQAGIPYIGV